ncbi:MAG: GNAT family N-acetyltransferase [Stellaceae bacterium]
MADAPTARPKRTRRLTYNVTGVSTNAARKTILKGLMGYNDAHVERNRWQSFAVVLNDSRGRVLGGMSGHTGWGWMYVELFWLPEELRRHGHGRKLMALAEQEARKRGCVGIYLNTAVFQAPGFYPKLGFKVFAEMDDFPPGRKTFFLMKRLDR